MIKMIKILLGKIFFKQLQKKMKQDIEIIKLPIWKANLINFYLKSIDY